MSLDFTVRCDADDALEAVIRHMQQRNNDLSVDDCIDAIFSVGLLAVSTTFTLTDHDQLQAQIAA